jgi:hypothetical protein
MNFFIERFRNRRGARTPVRSSPEFGQMLLIIVTAGLLGAVLMPRKVVAQTTPYNLGPQQPNFYRPDTNAFPITFTNSQTLILTNQYKLTIRQDRGLSIFVGMSPATNSGNAVVGLDVTYDGIGYTTNQPLYVVAPFNQALFWATNFGRDVLNNVRGVKASTVIVTNAGPNTITKFVYSWSGQ